LANQQVRLDRKRPRHRFANNVSQAHLHVSHDVVRRVKKKEADQKPMNGERNVGATAM
jgi:hypothetical protein